MAAVTFYLDISTLFQSRYTGISSVNYQLVKWFREHKRDESIFFHMSKVIDPRVIDELIKRKSGEGLAAQYEADLISVEELPRSLARSGYTTRVGLFANTKTVHGVFDFEAQIIYDLTFLLTPEFHHQDTIDHHGRSIESDVGSSDLLVCISQHTLDDVAMYLRMPRDRMMVAYLGGDDVACVAPPGAVEPYVLILGTVEPRKNIGLILDVLKRKPDLLDTWRFVFIGNDGWGTSFDALIAAAGLDRFNGDRILRLGFVSDAARNALLQNAKLLLYPSFYEGFGLPVLEALQVGCPIVAAFSSSIVEVGGDVVRYIDPYSTDDLEAALEEARDGHAAWFSSSERLRARADAFSWHKFCSSVHDRIVGDVGRLWNAG